MTYQEIPIGMLQYDEFVQQLSTLARIAQRTGAGPEYYAALFDIAGLHDLGPHLAARLEAPGGVSVEAPPVLRLGE